MERKYYNTTSASWGYVRHSQKCAVSAEEQLKEELLAIKELAHCIEALSEMAISGDQSGVANLTIVHLAKKIEQMIDVCNTLQVNSDETNQVHDLLRSFMKKSKKSGFFPE